MTDSGNKFPLIGMIKVHYKSRLELPDPTRFARNNTICVCKTDARTVAINRLFQRVFTRLQRYIFNRTANLSEQSH